MKKILMFLFLLACTTPAILTPAQGPGTDYPCGYHGVSCGGGMCCPENHVCGHLAEGVYGEPFSGCAPGMCCYVGVQ
jgi:hypothetical protein